jgi:uncharacterized protein (DUF736 family)
VRKHLVCTAFAAVVVMLLVGVAVASTTSVTITSPAAGQTISLKKTPVMGVGGTVSFATPTAGSTKYYLRRDGCGTSNDNPHLSVTSGTDAGDGCGLTFAVVGVGSEVDHGAYVDYPASDGLPLTIDSSRTISGVIDLEGIQNASAGLVTVDLTLEGLENGNGVTVGTDSVQTLMVPGQASYPVAFSFPPNASVDKNDLAGIDLRIYIHGPYIDSGFIANSGASWIALPTWSASFNDAVQVSLDDPSFANPIAASLDPGGWTAAIRTPAVGSHTLYARSTQGFDVSSVASRTFKVK